EALPRAVASAAARKARIVTGFEVTAIERRGRQWAVASGSEERVYHGLASTIPIPELLRALRNVPPDVAEAARALRYNASIFVLLGLKCCANPDLVAVYFPQPELVFNRVCFLHSFSPGCVPPGMYSLLAEVSCRPDDEVWRSSDEQITRRVAGELAGEGFILERDIVTTDVYRTPYSYVVYDLDYRRHRDRVRAYAESLGISLLGRFAEFEYLNSDQCFARAEALAQRLNAARAGRASTFA
ncbi:MAG TPA: FAD-dependent oxidoreductase, partial [Dehalococcoidia bacterium]|nr:FAD-dependent oxidoreductase [Dehalococcoidia bacterium]